MSRICGKSVRHHECLDEYRGWEGRGWDRVEKLQVFSGGGGRTDQDCSKGEPGGTKIQLIYTASYPYSPQSTEDTSLTLDILLILNFYIKS